MNKNVTFIKILLIIILCSCTNKQSEAQSDLAELYKEDAVLTTASSGTIEEKIQIYKSSWDNIKAISGESIDFEGNEISIITTDFAYGWVDPIKKYIKIKSSDIVAGLKVQSVLSQYYIHTNDKGMKETQLAEQSYKLQGKIKLTGVIEMLEPDSHYLSGGILFYPYFNKENEDLNFLRLTEKQYSDGNFYDYYKEIFISAAKKVIVSDIPFFFSTEDDKFNLMSLFDNTDMDLIEVSIIINSPGVSYQYFFGEIGSGSLTDVFDVNYF